MLQAFPFLDMLKMVFTGSGECHTINWSFLGLSMPFWVGTWFVLLGALIVAVNWRRLAAERSLHEQQLGDPEVDSLEPIEILDRNELVDRMDRRIQRP